MPCPKCGSQDPGAGPFCMSCGYRLSPQDLAPRPAAPQAPVTTPQASPLPQGPALPAPAPAPRVEYAPPSRGAGAPAPIRQMGEDRTQVPLSVWGPFAGHGGRGRHVSWLLNDQGEQADALVQTVIARFKRREIPRATVANAELQRRGRPPQCAQRAQP